MSRKAGIHWRQLGGYLISRLADRRRPGWEYRAVGSMEWIVNGWCNSKGQYYYVNPHTVAACGLCGNQERETERNQTGNPVTRLRAKQRSHKTARGEGQRQRP